MNHGRKLVELCEAWWEQPAGSVDALKRVGGEFLGCLGWEAAQTSDAGHAVTFEVHGTEGTRLDFAFLPPGRLEPSSKVVEQGLDYSPSAHHAVQTSRDHGATYVLVTDLCRSYLYDAATDELLIYADSPQLFLREVFDEVTKECVDEGGLVEIRRPSRSVMARHLRQWLQRWTEALTAGDEHQDSAAEHLLDQLVVARFTLDAGLLDAIAVDSVAAFQDVLAGRAREAVGPRWVKFCQTLRTRHGMTYFQPSGRLLQLTADEQSMAAMLDEFARMSRAKFSIPCVLESFNFGEAAEKARVRLVPEPNEEREKALASQALDTLGEFKLKIDVLEEGYRAIGYWFTELVGVYRRLGVPVRTGCAASPGNLELFAWSESEPDEQPSREEAPDAVTRALEDSLCVYYASPRQLRTARLLLHLYALDLYRRHGGMLGRFPDIDRAFTKRPTLLENEKRWIYDPPADHASGSWDA